MRRAIVAALRSIAEDFAATFNAHLAELARNDPHVEAVAPRYEMGPEHVDDLAAALRASISMLLDPLEAADVARARAATAQAWKRLERRIHAKWQSYFVLTFQEVSVERKAARDRVRPTIDPATAEWLAQAGAAPRGPAPASAPFERTPARASTWLALLALVVLLAAVGWLLVRGSLHSAAAGAPAPPPAPGARAGAGP